MAKNKRNASKIPPIQVDLTEKTELELNSAITNLKRFDYMIVPALAFIAAVWAFFHVGTSRVGRSAVHESLSVYNKTGLGSQPLWPYLFAEIFYVSDE